MTKEKFKEEFGDLIYNQLLNDVESNTYKLLEALWPHIEAMTNEQQKTIDDLRAEIAMLNRPLCEEEYDSACDKGWDDAIDKAIKTFENFNPPLSAFIRWRLEKGDISLTWNDWLIEKLTELKRG